MESNNVRPHKKLIVWQKSIDLVENIYKHSGKFPGSELYGLTNQLRRASEFTETMNHIGAMLNGLIRKVKNVSSEIPASAS